MNKETLSYKLDSIDELAKEIALYFSLNEKERLKRFGSGITGKRLAELISVRVEQLKEALNE